MNNSTKTPSDPIIGCVYLIKTQSGQDVYSVYSSQSSEYELPTGSMLMFHLSCENSGHILKCIQDVFKTKYIVKSINTYEGDYVNMMKDMFQVYVVQAQISNPSTTPCLPTCVNCNKTFKNKYNLKNHLPRCKGVLRRFTCDYCFRKFNHANNKYPHMRICKQRPQPIETTHVAESTECIPYRSTDMEFHVNVSYETWIRWLNTYDHKETFHEFMKHVLSIQSNEFIKKTNLRAIYSCVHMGDGKWELMLDKNLYKEALCNIANYFSIVINETVATTQRFKYMLNDKNKGKTVYKSLDAFVNYMAGGGYCNDDDDEKVKDIKDAYNSFEKELRLIVYNYSKATTTT